LFSVRAQRQLTRQVRGPPHIGDCALHSCDIVGMEMTGKSQCVSVKRSADSEIYAKGDLHQVRMRPRARDTTLHDHGFASMHVIHFGSFTRRQHCASDDATLPRSPLGSRVLHAGGAAPAPALEAVSRSIRAGFSSSQTTFESLGGVDDVAAAMRDLVTLPLTQPSIFHQFGLKPPRGVLMHGPPGSGKTVLARAAAADAGATLLVRSFYSALHANLLLPCLCWRSALGCMFLLMVIGRNGQYSSPIKVGLAMKTAKRRAQREGAYVAVVVQIVNGPEMLSQHAGESEAAVQALFAAARAMERAVIFLDEVDAFAPAREGLAARGAGHASEASARVLSALLTEMDGLSSDAAGGCVLCWNLPSPSNSYFPPLPPACASISLKVRRNRQLCGNVYPFF
jgi:hypothetical protein